jgi:hypothetical protein
MDDITTRLRRWTHDAHAAPASDLMDEAAADIERLREAMRVVPLYRQPPTCPYVVGRTTLHCSLTPFTLTAEEREAVEQAVAFFSRGYGTTADTLRGLLERTRPDARLAALERLVAMDQSLDAAARAPA